MTHVYDEPGTYNLIVGAANVGLAVLGDYGGPTQTMALLPGSPALDHGSNALATAAGLATGPARVCSRIQRDDRHRGVRGAAAGGGGGREP